MQTWNTMAITRIRFLWGAETDQPSEVGQQEELGEVLDL